MSAWAECGGAIDGFAGVEAQPRDREHRAARVRYPGEWLGCFEWIAWGVMRQVRVHMMFGEHVMDII